MNNNETKFFVKEYPSEIYSVSSELWARQKVPGGAIMQTWIIKGKNKVMAIDSPVPEIQGFREFIENQFGLPVIMVNSHGHIDHTGCNRQFDEVWISKKDWSLLAGGGIVRTDNQTLIKELPYKLSDIREGYVFNLGERDVTAYSVPGHTLGSMVFFDSESKALFSGDAVARRVLYGISDYTPLEKYLEALQKLKSLDIKSIFSMHDDFELPYDMPKKIINNISNYLEQTKLIWNSPTDGRKFRRILLGENEESPDFFDFVIPVT